MLDMGSFGMHAINEEDDSPSDYKQVSNAQQSGNKEKADNGQSHSNEALSSGMLDMAAFGIGISSP